MASKQHSVEWKLKIGTEGGAEVQALKRDLDALGRVEAFAKLKKDTAEAEKKWQEATAGVAKLSREMAAAEKPTKAMATQMDRARAQAGALKDQFARSREELQRQRKALSDAGIGTTNLSSAYAVLKKRAQESAQAQRDAAAATKAAAEQMNSTTVAKSVGTGSLAQDAKESIPVLSSLAGTIGTVAVSLVSLQAAGTVLSKLREEIIKSDTASFNLQSSIDAANREFENTGSVYLWKLAIAELGDQLQVYNQTDLKNAASRTVDMTKRLGLSFDQMREIIRRSGDLGAGKLGIEESVERVTAALRGEAEASEYLGLTLNEDYVKAWYNASNVTNKAWKDLNDVEKAQQRYALFLVQTNEIVGRSAASVQTLGGSWNQATAKMSDFVTNSRQVQQASTATAKLVSETGKLAPALAAGTLALLSGGGPIDAYMAVYQEANRKTIEGYQQTGEALRKLREMDALYTSQAEGAAGATSKSIAADIAEWKKKKWDEVLAKAKSSLKEAVDEERSAAEQIRAIQQQMTDATRSTDALVRETLRSTMTEGQQYQDKLAEARQTMATAATLLASGDAEQAKRLYEEAQRQFAALRTEVKEGETVVVSSAQAQANALNGIKEAGKGIQDALNIDKAVAESQLGIASDKKERIMADITDIQTAMARIKDIDVAVRANDYASEKLQEIYKELDALKDKTITITTRYVTEGGGSGSSSGSSSESSGESFGSNSTYGGQSGYGYARGGRVGFAGGGKLPGYSPGVDNLLGMLRSGHVFGLSGGEDVTNARSTQVIYQTMPGLMPLLNRVRSSSDVYAVLLKALGGKSKAVPDISRLTKNMQGYAQGGIVRENYRVTLAVPSAGVESTVTTSSKAEATGLVALAKALDRARLVGGKA